MEQAQALSASQRAGDTATQIGTVGGNVVHIVRQRLGFWGFLAATIVTFGTMGFLATLVDEYFDDSAEGSMADGFGAPGLQGGPVQGLSSSDSSATTGFADASFAASGGSSDYGVASGRQVGASMLPAGGLDAQAAQAQLVPIGAGIMQFVNSVETQAIMTRDPFLAATIFAGEPLLNIQARIGELVNWGLFEQLQLEQGHVLAVRVVSSSPWSTLVQIDACEYWSSATYNGYGVLVASMPRHAVPQTVTLEMANGQAHVIDIDFDVDFPGCW